MKYARRRDENEPTIVEALVRVGASVTRLTPLSKADDGVPDLLVGFRGATYLLEVKMPAGPEGGTSHRDLSESQERWWAASRGRCPVLVRTVDEALAAIGATRV